MCKYDGYDQYMYDMMGGTYLVKQFTEKDTDTNKKNITCRNKINV